MIIAVYFQQTDYCFPCLFFFYLQISNSKYLITTLMLLTECALLKMPV